MKISSHQVLVIHVIWNIDTRLKLDMQCLAKSLTHWGQVIHIRVSKLTIIGSDDGLSPDRRQAII